MINMRKVDTLELLLINKYDEYTFPNINIIYHDDGKMFEKLGQSKIITLILPSHENNW